jgi:hypothetical protein
MDVLEQPQDTADDIKTDDTRGQADTADTQPEVDYNSLDPSRIPHEVVSKTHQFQGIINDVATLRQSVRQLEQERNDLEAKLSQQAEDNVDPEALVTQADMDKTIAGLKAEIEQKNRQLQQQDQSTKENQSVTRLRDQYSAKTAGPGLDADTVIREGGQWLAQNKPGLFKAARESADPAREIYDLSLSLCPAIKQRAQSIQSEKLLSQIKPGGNLHGADAEHDRGETGDILSNLLGMGDEDLMAQIEAEELGP